MKRQLPTPTASNPYAQVDFIFNLIAETKTNKSTKNNYTNALTFYKKYLDKTSNYNMDFAETGLFYLHKHLDELALVNVKRYIDTENVKGSEGYLSTHSIVGIFSAIRTVLNEAILLGYTSFENLINVSMADAARETDANIAYSEFEMNQIKTALKEELKYVYKVYRKDGYKATGVGQDPRKDRGLWKNIDNMRWYFENVLGFEPILGTPENKKAHKNYVERVPTAYYTNIGGLRGIYRKWGVAPLIDADLIMPLVLQIAIETGLNVQSILELDLDCFEEKNPISGVPILKYYKQRSTGDKQLHLNIHNDEANVSLKEFRQEQAKIIQNTIAVVKELTKDIRKEAPLDIQNKLFILQSSSTRKFGEIININSKISSRWSRQFVEKYDLKNDLGERLNFNLKRFRSTRATQLVHKGVELHELQYEMGHKSITTTMHYVDKNKLNDKANQETSAAIETIFSNKAWAENTQVQYAKKSTEANENTIFKGFLCDCKNPFNPPDDVKKLKDYQEGDVCSRVNMCLFCDNVMIFKRNLPSLWMYKRQIELTLEMQSQELPNERYYLKTLNIIDALFNPETSEFEEQDLEEAKLIAQNLDELVDPVTYQAESEGF